MVVLVLRIYDYEHAVFCAGLGRGNAEDAWAVLLAREEERKESARTARSKTYERKDFPDCAVMLDAIVRSISEVCNAVDVVSVQCVYLTEHPR